MADGNKTKKINRPREKTQRKKKKEDSSVTLAKFMKANVDGLNESVKAGGMKADRVIEGSNMRSKKGYREDVEAGIYKKPSKDAAYYKSIGLTGKRGDAAVEDFFKPDEIRLKNILDGKYAKGGKVKLALRGGGRAYGKNSWWKIK